MSSLEYGGTAINFDKHAPIDGLFGPYVCVRTFLVQSVGRSLSVEKAAEMAGGSSLSLLLFLCLVLQLECSSAMKKTEITLNKGPSANQILCTENIRTTVHDIILTVRRIHRGVQRVHPSQPDNPRIYQALPQHVCSSLLP